MEYLSMSARLITPAVARILPFAVFITFIVLQSVAGEWLTSLGFDARWLYPARAVAVAIMLVVLWPHFVELRGVSGVSGGQFFAAVAAGIAVFVLWINLDFEWASVGKPLEFDPTHADGSTFDWLFVTFRLFGLALIVPVMEELFWRSFLFRWIDRHDFLAHDPAAVSLRAVLIGAVLFASEHNLWLAGLLAGLVYSVVYMRTGNLWLPILSHATTNAALGCWILATGQWQFW